MLLGSLIAGLENESNAALALEALGDLPLYARVRLVGEGFDEPPGAYVAGAVRRFCANAQDEDWLRVMGAVERAQIPARAILTQVLHWALDEDERELRGQQSEPQHTSCQCGGGGRGGSHGHLA